MILVLLSLLSHFQTNTHTHTTNLDFFSKAACVIQSLFFNTSGSILPLVYCTIIFSWWRACFWPHWLSLVLPPLQFNPFTWCGVKIRVRRWTIITGRWHRKLPLHKADSEALIFFFFFYCHGFGLSGFISGSRQPASATVGADQHAHMDICGSLARAHVSTGDGCRKALESEKQMQIWAIDHVHISNCQ